MGRLTKHSIRYKKVGRTPKYDAEMRQKIEACASWDFNDTEICLYVGVSRDTFWRWKKKYKHLSDNLDVWRRRPLMRAKKTLYAGIETDPDLSLKLLQNKDRENYSTKQEQKHTGKLQVEDVTESDDSDPEVEQAVGQLEEALRKSMTKKK